MTFANCPRCGSMNNTAGICPNCGWSQFAQVTTVSTRITGEIEIMLSGKALLDDYKRLLLENRNLKERIAELEEAQRWIPVSGRLPEPYTHVLAAAPTGYMEVDWRFSEPIIDCGLANFYSLDNVTHWMPLPQPPEVKE